MRGVLLLLGAVLVFDCTQSIQVSCIGDSITAGVCSQQTKGYPTVLQNILGSGFTVSNFGNSGKTLLKKGLCGPPAGGDCSYMGTSSWPSALASKPDIVTIMLGTNDAKEFNWFGVQNNQPDSWVLDYFYMIKTLASLPSAPKVIFSFFASLTQQIFVLTLVPLYTPFPYDMNATVINSIISDVPNGLVAQIASIAGVEIIDVHAAFTGYGANVTCDGCHPTDQGYTLIAQTLAPFIRKAALAREMH